ncbi:MAG: hypothetical protein ACKO4T_14655 [Planctomycetaceae bacterium]
MMRSVRPPLAAFVVPARRGLAWVVCLAVVGGVTAGGLVVVDTWARQAFTAHRAGAVAPPALLGPVVGSIAVTDDVVIRHEFDADRDGLAGLQVRTVTWGAEPDAYECRWSLVESSPDGRAWHTVRSGTIATSSARDWGSVELRFDPVADSLAGRYAVRITTGTTVVSRPLGLPLFAASQPSSHVIVRRRKGSPPAVPAAATLDVRPLYAGEGG